MKLSSVITRGWLVLTLALCSSTQAAVINFAGSPSVVLVGEPVALRVEITYEAGEISSLFSYGVALLPGSGTSGLTALSIDVPAPLDFNGILGPGAMQVIRSDLLGAKGTVDLSAAPTPFYSEKLVATFNLRFDNPGAYSLRLDFFNTLGPTEDIFVTGGGTVLDDDISFGSTLIQAVIPEPHAAALFTWGIGCLVFRRRR